jgi:transcriptional regulator with XRE-family HTH domain
MKSQFSERLKAARVLRDITQKELSNTCGIDASQIANFELGNRNPSLNNLKKLCESLNVSADYLLGISEYPYVTQHTVMAKLMSELSNRDLEIIRNILHVFSKVGGNNEK